MKANIVGMKEAAANGVPPDYKDFVEFIILCTANVCELHDRISKLPSSVEWKQDAIEKLNCLFGEDLAQMEEAAKYCRHADARLIAAAPELYEALNGLVDFIDRECVPCGENACELMTIAHAALAAASGESEVTK